MHLRHTATFPPVVRDDVIMSSTRGTHSQPSVTFPFHSTVTSPPGDVKPEAEIKCGADDVGDTEEAERDGCRTSRDKSLHDVNIVTV